MWKLKNYKFGINYLALLIFVLIMIPNLLWMAFPAPYDVLSRQDGAVWLEILVKILQPLMVGSLICLQNREFRKPVKARIFVGICLSYFVYMIGWGFYYLGFSGPVVILTLCIAPSCCFMLEAWGRKYGPGYVLSLLFLIFHTLWGVITFLE